MKRYMLFHGDRYYPLGGWDDFVGSYDSIDDAKSALDQNDTKSPSGGWAHITDMETLEKVSEADIDNTPPNYRVHTVKWTDAA